LATKKSADKKATKKAAKKTNGAPKRSVSPELLEAAKTARARKKEIGHFTLMTALSVPCLPVDQATGIVFGCLGKPVRLDQTLGQLFPLATARGGFCRCVSTAARQAGVGDPQVPCQATTTVGEVIQSISC